MPYARVLKNKLGLIFTIPVAEFEPFKKPNLVPTLFLTKLAWYWYKKFDNLRDAMSKIVTTYPRSRTERLVCNYSDLAIQKSAKRWEGKTPT